jgi:hypothetical protein
MTLAGRSKFGADYQGGWQLALLAHLVAELDKIVCRRGAVGSATKVPRPGER